MSTDGEFLNRFPFLLFHMLFEFEVSVLEFLVDFVDHLGHSTRINYK